MNPKVGAWTLNIMNSKGEEYFQELDYFDWKGIQAKVISLH